MCYSKNGGSSYTTYFYGVNAQGDVEKIFRMIKNADTGEYEETVYGLYSYDAWGSVTATTAAGNTPATTTLVYRNPIRYRGYVYDNETGFYYLQSRYYDPEQHRFINADTYVSTGQGIIGTNMFAYCRNNPVKRTDASGFSDKIDEDGDGDIYELELYGGGGSGGYVYGGESYTTSSYASSGYTSSGYYSSSVSYTFTTSGSTTSTSTSSGTYNIGTGSYFSINTASSAFGGTNPLAGIKYTDKVISQMSCKDNHGFPSIVDNHGALGEKEIIRGGDGKSYFKLKIRGSYHGESGSFEYIWDSETGECNHRFFRKLE